MKKDQNRNLEMDLLIKRALESDDEYRVSFELADATVNRLRKKILLKELIVALAFKIGIGFGSLGILAGVYVLTDSQLLLKKIFDFALINKPIVLLFLITSVVIIITDQIIIKYFSADEVTGTMHKSFNHETQ